MQYQNCPLSIAAVISMTEKHHRGEMSLLTKHAVNTNHVTVVRVNYNLLL